MLGDISITLLLFSLGVRLTDATCRTWKAGFAGAVVRPVLGMLIAWIAAGLLGLDKRQSGMLLVFGALPPAVLNFIFAERYRQEPEKVASIVMIGNIAALVFVSVALAFALP
jgi:predicted permease